ncbi:LOW QUALITY PROTEIN: N-acetylgalactosamine kinase-like [Ciona intestinalis]
MDPVVNIVSMDLESLKETNVERYTRYKTLIGKFVEKFNEGPQFVSRAPGRVNLIGEHIDYCGYSVLPMALTQDLSLAVRTNSSTVLRISNINSEFSDYIGDMATFIINSDKPGWFNYILCGIEGILESASVSNPPGMDIMVDSSRGLSSSSALVCAAGLATAHACNCSLTRLELADICMRCERYIGTQGGGMDQSISFLAQQGMAKLISFNPLRSDTVVLPDGAVFVVTNSCVTMKKADTAHFNTRVTECKVAAQMLASWKSLDRSKVKTLGDVHEMLGVDLDAMVKMVDDVMHDQPYNVGEVGQQLGMSGEEVKEKLLFKNTSQVDSFKLKQRATHVFSEARRVFKFKEVCSETTNPLVKLGELMNESHDSCSRLYEASCKELDQLTELCRKHGALGSRFTGAGWGGCAVSLVPSDKLNDFIGSLRTSYYANMSDSEFAKAVFFTAPGGGAGVYVI